MNLIIKNVNELILRVIQITHWMFLIICSVSSIMIINALINGNEPFWICLPLLSWIGYLAFSRVLDCPWTRLENYYRSKCGHPEIKTFIGHNIVKPIRNFPF